MNLGVAAPDNFFPKEDGAIAQAGSHLSFLPSLLILLSPLLPPSLSSIFISVREFP
jgi:hypothetical protein